MHEDDAEIFVEEFPAMKRKLIKSQEKYDSEDSLGNISDEDFKNRCDDKLAFLNWEIRIAPPSNDIIWENITNRGKCLKTFIRFCSWTILIIFSVVLITPLTLLDNLNPIIDVLNSYLEDIIYIKGYFQLFLTPLCLYIFNYVFIPILINILINYERRSRKSHNAKTKFRKNFFFFILNQIMLPMLGFTTIYQLFEYMSSLEFKDWPETLANKVSPSGTFFLRYIIQISLISNTFQLLSLPKLFWDFVNSHTWYCKKIKRKKESDLADVVEQSLYLANSKRSNLGKRLNLSNNKDDNDFYFDLAYQQAFSISIFTMIFLFSTINPIILPFGCLFFTLKYFIDKYNIVQVYPLEFDSKGFLRRTICIFMIVSIGINQFFCIGFFIAKNDKSYNAAAFVHAVVMGVGTYYIISKQPWKPAKKAEFVQRSQELHRIGTRIIWSDKKDQFEAIDEFLNEGDSENSSVGWTESMGSDSSYTGSNRYNIVNTNMRRQSTVEENKFLDQF